MRRVSVILEMLCVLGLASFTVAISSPNNRKPETPLLPPEKDFVIDGSVVHDVGQLLVNITNWGLIGSHPGSGAPYAHAPSARWPGVVGDDYLYAAGLWVGAKVDGVPYVSTGQLETEFHPTAELGDTIFVMVMGEPGGARYPDPEPDDDGDGMEDEDPKNGLDDDDDGLIDEDFAAISDQHFRCVNSDTAASTMDMNPDHIPLGLQVIQQTYQWSDELADDSVGLDFTIRNIGTTTLEDVYIGIYADCDIPAGVPDGGADDMAGFFEGYVRIPDGSFIPISVGYIYDAAEVNPLAGYIGFLLLDYRFEGESDPTADPVSWRTFDGFVPGVPYDQGGEPTDDTQRYETLSGARIDPNTQPGKQNDFSFLLACGPIEELAPSRAIVFSAAIVLGEQLMGLNRNAGISAHLYRGVWFNRDGDDETGPDGKEFHVRWLHPDDVPTSAISGMLTATVQEAGIRLTLATNLESVTDLSVVCRGRAGTPERWWDSNDFFDVRSSLEGTTAALVDEDPASWPRAYVLYCAGPYGDHILDEIDLDRPPLPPLALETHPNPFNPQVEIKFVLPEACSVQLDIFDLQGRFVRNLIDENRLSGECATTWGGNDHSGRPVASGTYQLLLRTDQNVTCKSITLVR